MSVENQPSRPTNDTDRSVHMELRLRDPDADFTKQIEYLLIKAPGVRIIIFFLHFYIFFIFTLFIFCQKLSKMKKKLATTIRNVATFARKNSVFD